MSARASRGLWIRGALLAVGGLAFVAVGAVSTGAATEVAVALIVVGAGLFTAGVVLPQLVTLKVGPGGFEATLRQAAEVEEAVRPREERLAHLATWLQGDPEAGRRALEEALARLSASPRVADPVQETLRRVVETAPPAVPPEPASAPAPPGGGPTPYDEARTLLSALRGLPRERRAAAVLELLGDAGSEEAAWILGRTREKVEEDLSEALSQLPGLIARAAGGAA